MKQALPAFRIPTEDEECYTFANYLRAKGYQFGHINNEFYTKSWKQKSRQLAMGTAKGFPDYVIIANGKLVMVEMKRTKGGVVSEHQKKWLAELNAAGVTAIICRGAKEAIKMLTDIVK